MCLDTVTKRIKKPTDDEIEGWKIFAGRGVRVGTVETHVTNDVLKVNQWHKADNSIKIGAKPHQYTAGFHILLDKPKRCPQFGFLKKVKGRRVRLFGEQSAMSDLVYKIAVADELYIPHRIVKKPALKKKK